LGVPRRARAARGGDDHGVVALRGQSEERMRNAIAHNHGGTQQLEKTVTRGMTSLGMWNPCARTRDARPRPSGRRRRPRRLACIRRARFRRTHSGQVGRDAVLRSPVKYQSVAKGESKAEKKIVERQSSTPPRRRVGSKTSLPGSRAPLPLAHDAHCTLTSESLACPSLPLASDVPPACAEFTGITAASNFACLPPVPQRAPCPAAPAHITAAAVAFLLPSFNRTLISPL
jgi:hypothetical protein